MSLTISRKELDRVTLFTGADEQIVITVSEISATQIKLTFDAPMSVDIWRDELLDLDDGYE